MHSSRVGQSYNHRSCNDTPVVGPSFLSYHGAGFYMMSTIWLQQCAWWIFRVLARGGSARNQMCNTGRRTQEPPGSRKGTPRNGVATPQQMGRLLRCLQHIGPWLQSTAVNLYCRGANVQYVRCTVPKMVLYSRNSK
jgi:hypothetical protein